jgi:hypothetical protein
VVSTGAAYVLPTGSAVEFDHLSVADGEVLEVGGMRVQVFGLDGFRVVDVVRVDDRELPVVTETVDAAVRCPDCDAPCGRREL